MASLQPSLWLRWRLPLLRLQLARPVSSIRPTTNLLPANSNFRLAYPRLAVLSLLPLRIPSLLQDVWESILRAVPKKKTTHSRTRKRQLTGKALKDVTELVKCPACGGIKRAHVLCFHCVKDIQHMWKGKDKPSETTAAEKT